jgi:gluconokinase
VAAAPAVLAVDIGTTATKAVVFDVEGRGRGEAKHGYELSEPHPGWAVQDPGAMLEAVLAAGREAAAAARENGADIQGVSFSSAMHSLLGLDAEDRPLTPSISWADTRASDAAEQLRAGPAALELHRRTGTPVHPMSPLVKLVWLREHDPELFARVHRWIGIKEWVLAHLTGEWAMDHSLASGTGLFDMAELDWSAEALELAGVTRDQLPPLVETTACFSLTASGAERLGLEPSTPLVAGAGDGPLANLGVGAVRPGVAACSIGTSGALRVVVEDPAVDRLGRVFCYALSAGRWVVGGAINNGGVVLHWAGDALAPDLGDEPARELLELAARSPAGAKGLVMLPYLLSERAPHWSAVARGAYVGLTRAHRREHLVRAALEGVCQQLALVLESMRDAGNEIHEIRATGGFARSALWRQMLCDVLGMDIAFPAGSEGSGFGAALLGMEALGLVDTIELAADLVSIKDVAQPDPASAATYAMLRPVFSALYDALSPAWSALERIAPEL